MKKHAAPEKKLHTLYRNFSIFLASNATLRLAAQCGAAFAGTFLLAGIALFGRNVPISLALISAMPFSLAAICAFLGSAVGYLAFWGIAGAFEPIAAGFLILAELCIFSGLLPRDRKWFLPASSCSLYLLIAVLSLLSTSVHPREVFFLAARLALLAVSSFSFSAAWEPPHRGRGFLALCLLAGCSGIRLFGSLPLSVPLAGCLVFLSCSGTQALSVAAACGLTLDLTCPADTSATIVFTLASLVCRLAPEGRLLRAALFWVCCLCGTLLCGETNGTMLFGLFLGTLPALAAPQSLRQRFCLHRPDALQTRLSEVNRVCDLMNEVSRTLDRAHLHDLEPQSAAVFDKAAEQVCKSCGRYHDCWEAHGAGTYLLLSRAAGRIFQRGLASREDLPEAFVTRCCYADGFLTAVNEALDEQRTRLQYQRRLAESREILSDHFRCLSRLLQRICDFTEPDTPVRLSFIPDLGFRARGIRADTVSGDHGSCFTCGEWYYVLLCDGMGTGAEASRESVYAIHFLSELLLSGLEAQDAMQMLNGLYLLRGDGGFSTMDLLQLNLVSGEGFLLKWGAAPSYLKQARRTQKLGNPAPPPGLRADGKCRPECIRVCLREGETLVMVSDGVDSARAEQWLRNYSGRSPRELAAGILACDGSDPDDRTALAVCLRPCPQPRRGVAVREKFLSKFRA